jgi:SAM-dependent methyltransferase
MSILDIGCYDGYLLHAVSDLPFRKMVGIEPRSKNIRKGEIARELLGIETRVEFRRGGLEDLDRVAGEPFDVVVATGLLHHVESPAEALRALRRVCRGMLFLETIILDSRHLSSTVRREVEPKDVVYYGREKLVGLSAQKLESGYYDGSATGLRVVSLPSLETLRLCLDVASFAPPSIEAAPDAYRDRVWKGRRPFHAVILTAAPLAAGGAGCGQGREYERSLAASQLRSADLAPLSERYLKGFKRVRHTELSRAAAALIRTPGSTRASEAIGRLVSDPAQREILRALPHAPQDKIAVESGKQKLAAGDLDGAKTLFRRVTTRWNADWRSVYRSLHYLAQIAQREGDRSAFERYSTLLATANPEFPTDAWPARGQESGGLPNV